MEYTEYLSQLNESSLEDVMKNIRDGNYEELTAEGPSVKNTILKRLSVLNTDKANAINKVGFEKQVKKLISSGKTEEEAWKIIKDEIIAEINAIQDFEKYNNKATKLENQLNIARSNLSKIKSKDRGSREIAKLIADGKTEEEAWEILKKEHEDVVKELATIKQGLDDDILVVQKTGDISSVSNVGCVVSHNYLNAVSDTWRHPTKPRAITLEGGLRISIGKPESKLNYIVTNKEFEQEKPEATIIKQALDKIRETQIKIAATIELMFSKKGLKYYSEDDIETFKTVKAVKKADEKELEDMFSSNFFDTISKEEPKTAEKEETKEEPKSKEPKKEKIDVSKLSNDDLADLFL